MQQTKIDFDLKGLRDFKEQIGDTYRARVGILDGGQRNNEDGSTIDNVTLGIIQMFGSITKNIPPRDFLVMPIEMHKKEILNKLSKKDIQEAIKQNDIKKVYELLGVIGLEYVQQAFETGGFGQWKPNKPSTVAKKKSSQPLIDTGQLRRSITNDVVKKSEAEGAIANV